MLPIQIYLLSRSVIELNVLSRLCLNIVQKEHLYLTLYLNVQDLQYAIPVTIDFSAVARMLQSAVIVKRPEILRDLRT